MNRCPTCGAPMHEPSLIGHAIRQLRLDRGWTQADLGKRMVPAVSHAAISDIERGDTHVSIELLSSVSKVFGVRCSIQIGDAVLELVEASE